MLALGACANAAEWEGGPVAFEHEGAQWEITKQHTAIVGRWLNPPANVDEPQVRYAAIRAFRAYAGCKPAPRSMEITGAVADALMRC